MNDWTYPQVPLKSILYDSNAKVSQDIFIETLKKKFAEERWSFLELLIHLLGGVLDNYMDD